MNVTIESKSARTDFNGEISGAELPAIAGASPAKTAPFTRAKRYGEEERRELEAALEQGTLFYSQGKKTRQLEEEFATRNGAKFGVACSSGTAALHAATIAAGISPSDEVIVTPITDMGSIVPILYQGAIPVFADLDPHSYELDAKAVENAITPRTKAIIAVHLWGNTPDMDALLKICKRHNLILIEDCAQAFGSRYKNRPVGTMGALGCFSFNEFKHISCGDGGIVLTSDPQLAERARLATDKCYNRSPDAVIKQPKFLANNYRITELQSAVAVAQLRKLDSIVARRQTWCSALSESLQSIPGLHLPQPTPGCEPSWWFYMMRVEKERLGADTDEFAAALKAEGLPVSAHYIGKPIYGYPVFQEHSAYERGAHGFEAREYKSGDCPTAEAILSTCIQLAINEGYTPTDLEETSHAIRRVAAWFARRH